MLQRKFLNKREISLMEEEDREEAGGRKRSEGERELFLKSF